MESKNQIVSVLNSAGLTQSGSDELINAFGPHFEAVMGLVEKSSRIVVTDPSQVTEIMQARDARLAIRRVRIASEATRKELKEDSLRRGKAIDNVAKVVSVVAESEEERLENMEKIAARIEHERKTKVKAEREAAIAKYLTDTTGYDFYAMTQPVFDSLLESSRLAHAARIEAEQKAATERADAIRKQEEENARIRAENERLRQEREAAKAEREAMEAKAKAEREAAAAAFEKERKAREELEAKARREREAAEAAEREAAAKARAAELAPDREKILAFASVLRGLTVPSVSSPKAAEAVESIRRNVARLADSIDGLAKAL